MQDDDEKREAIISLLPLLWLYRGYMPGALKVQRYGEAEDREKDPDWRPAPVWRTLDCDGRCLWGDDRYHCEWQKDCKGEWWQVSREKLARAWRLEALSRSMDGLLSALPAAWRAVVAIYVDPYESPSEPIDEWHHNRRQAWADKGIEWMAREIPGEMPNYYEARIPWSRRVERRILEGQTQREIIRDLGGSARDISRIYRAVKVRQECTVSAAS